MRTTAFAFEIPALTAFRGSSAYSEIDAILATSIIRDEGDLFTLTDAALARVPSLCHPNGFLNEIGTDLVNQIAQAKEQPLWRVCQALDLPLVRPLASFFRLSVEPILDPDMLAGLPDKLGSDARQRAEIIEWSELSWRRDILRNWLRTGLRITPIQVMSAKKYAELDSEWKDLKRNGVGKVRRSASEALRAVVGDDRSACDLAKREETRVLERIRELEKLMRSAIVDVTTADPNPGH